MITPALLAGIVAAASPVFHLHDPRLDELSGIAVGIRSSDVAYVQNDSGDSARFFALDLRTGALRATITVPDAVNHDWEDLAVAPDAHGTPSVWLADIGDNDAERSRIELYRVDEPKVGSATTITATRPQVWTLHYPDGPHDAESLAVSPEGVPYLVTKSFTGASEVFSAPSTPGAATLRRVGSIQFQLTGTPGPFAPLGELTATGAALSPDGSRLVVRTYTDAYVWPVRHGDVAAALRTAPQRIPLPEQPQGEGVCFDGNHLLVDSEGAGSAVYSVPIPETPRPSETARAATTASPTPRSSAVVHPSTARHSHNGAFAALLAVAVVFLAAGASAVLRFRRRGGRAGSAP
ncbi:hypothetical protein [Jatrophihabitans sp.]|uniref:hypothetical protein n=1 Tax=Jatrophihabitans sp. TaxID=1932789 RepID=UPI0030C7339C|nr:uncharacterized protein [Jatrophihabitans sp.]